MTTTITAKVSVRELVEGDLDEAERICRVAFGTHLGVPEPELFFGDTAYVPTRYAAPNTVALAAEIDGELVGSNFVTGWGSFGFFGPLSVRVDLWDKGIATALMEETMGVFGRWGTEHAALFTWADSAKHHGLYQKFGFYPTFLTPVMSKPVAAKAGAAPMTLSSTEGPASTTEACRRVSEDVYPGLDLSGEMRSVAEQKLGDVVVVVGAGAEIEGFAICHVGSGTEAGGGACFVKFGAVRPGDPERFGRLVDACEAFAAREGAQRLVLGVNMGRLEAYRALVANGFRADLTGVAMQQGGEAGYNRPDVFAIDDWR